MSLVAFVPLKLNNVRLPNKNLLLLGGKPLFMHIVDTLLSISIIDQIYIFCSDEIIKQYLPQKVIFLKRDCCLDTNETLGIDIYKEFAKHVPASIYLLCHATSPFISKVSIIKGINAVKNDNYDSSMSVLSCKKHCYVDKSPINFLNTTWPRTQDLNCVYQSNSAFFVYKSHLLNENIHISSNPYFVECGEIESIDIDYPSDFEYATYIVERIPHRMSTKPIDLNNTIPMIRKRTVLPFHEEKRNMHILTGQRYSKKDPYPLFFSEGDSINIIEIIQNGVKNKTIEILPLLNENNSIIQKCTKIYEKRFVDLNDDEYNNLPFEINDAKSLSLYLGLIYNMKTTEIKDGYVTIIITNPKI